MVVDTLNIISQIIFQILSHLNLVARFSADRLMVEPLALAFSTLGISIPPEILAIYRFWFSKSGMDSRFCSSRNLPGIIDGISPHAFLRYSSELCPGTTFYKSRKQNQKETTKAYVFEWVWNLDTVVADHLTLPEDPEMAGRSHNSDETGWCWSPWSNKWRCITSFCGGCVLKAN